jgi:hypothetical protein
MMIKEVFVIWSKKDARLTLIPVNYGLLCIYLTREQAEAQLNKDNDKDHEVRQMILSEGT